MDNWMKKGNNNGDVVLTSRVRLARNLKGIPFPHKLADKDGRDVIKKVEDAFFIGKGLNEIYSTHHIWENDNIKNRVYLEKHLISPKLLKNGSKSGFIVDKDETVSLMMNEEDHIRLQCITGGLNLEEAYETAGRIDDLLEENLDYAFDEKLGYLTACPTNLGTGLRASAMLHLPALTMSNEMAGASNSLGQVGMMIRGLYGEGTKSYGNLYQISNQITLGISEDDIIRNLEAVVNQFVNQEKIAREGLIKNYKNEIEDKIFRSLGILRSAVLIDSKESLKCMSYVRMGIEMGIVKDVDKSVLNSLLIAIQPASLQDSVNSKLSEKERDFERAKLIREKLDWR